MGLSILFSPCEVIEQPLRRIWHTAGTNEKLQRAEWKGKGERVLLRVGVLSMAYV